MRNMRRVLLMLFCVLGFSFFAMSMQAEAGNITSGTIGDNGGISWTYDENTKTLTVSGEDTGTGGDWENGSALPGFWGMEKIIMKDCKVYDCDYLFAWMGDVKSIVFDNFDTSECTSMNSMFYDCCRLESLDLSGLDTSNVTDMSYMFSWCENLTELNLNGFDTSNVTTMEGMFQRCLDLRNLDLRHFDTSKVQQMRWMFQECNSLASVDVSNFDTSQVSGMNGMFSYCWALENVDVSGFNTSKVRSMHGMFEDCISLSGVDVSGFETSNLQFIGSMFWNCKKLQELDLSSFNLENINMETQMNYAKMLNGCNALRTIYAPAALKSGLEIELPDTFVDEQGNSTQKITKEFCNKTLVSESVVLVKAFVERMYTVALGRAAEAEGLIFYTQRLFAGDSNGACLAESFLCSPEFLNKGYDDAQYVKVLYKTFFDREPATEEVNYWVGKLTSGNSRAFVLAGFVNSAEFDNLCTNYGISRGFMYQDGKPINPGIGRFAERLYTVVLERAGEKDGIEYWTLCIANGTCTPKDAAKNFFLSPEYVNKYTFDEEYIKTLYRTFMDREPDGNGVDYWLEVLYGGATREQILEGFADSAEFKGIMANYGL